jgi:hypothetical protein
MAPAAEILRLPQTRQAADAAAGCRRGRHPRAACKGSGQAAQGRDATGRNAGSETPPLFTEDETATLAKFREDWPKEAEAVDLMQRELGRGVIQYVFDQIAPEVKQLRELVQTLAMRAHQSDLDATIGEYPSDEEIDSIKKWVKTQPTYLQGG